MITLETNSLVFPKTTSSTTIIYYTDEVLTDIELNYCNWMTVTHNYNSSTKSGTITIAVHANANTLRTCQLTITGKELGHTSTGVVDITQLIDNFDGTGHIGRIIVDGRLSSTPVLVDVHEHEISVELIVSKTIYNVISTHDTTKITQTDETFSQIDVNFNRYIIYYKLYENDTNTDRNVHITYTLIDMNGSTAQLDLDITQYTAESGYIVVNDVHIDADEQTISVDYTPVNTDNVTAHISSSWITLVSNVDDKLTLDIDANRSNVIRSTTITLSGTWTYDPYTIVTAQFTITQARAIYTDILPTWKDYLIDLSLDPTSLDDDSTIYYTVFAGDNLVFTGHCYYIGDVPQINITEIIREYCIDSLRFPLNNDRIYIDNYLQVQVYSSDKPDNITNRIAVLQYYYDYVYDVHNSHVTPRIRNIPVLDIVDSRQNIMFSFLNLSGETNNIRIEQGMHVFTYDTSLPGIHQYNGTTSDDTIIARFNGEVMSYKRKNTCSRFCLYYLNLLGGWDSLLFEGRTVETENYERLQTIRDYINTTADPGTTTYKNNITQIYRLTTRYLNDEQSHRMIHLLRSPKAFLHDLITDTIMPVVINNKNTDIKTFYNQGHKFFTYTVELQASQTHITMN